MRIKLPNGQVAEFPDGTSMEVVTAIIQKQFPPTQPPVAQPEFPASKSAAEQGVAGATGPPTLMQRALPYALKGLEYAAMPFAPLSEAVDIGIRQPLSKIPALGQRQTVPFEATQDPMAMAAGPLGRGEGLSGETVEMPSIADTTATLAELGLTPSYGRLAGFGAKMLGRGAVAGARGLAGLIPKPIPTMSKWGEAVSPVFNPLSETGKSLFDIPPAMRPPIEKAAPIAEVAPVAPTAELGQTTSKLKDFAQAAGRIPQAIVGGSKLKEPSIEPFQPVSAEAITPGLEEAWSTLDRAGVGLTAPEAAAPLVEPSRPLGPFSFMSAAPEKRAEYAWQRGLKGRTPPSRMPSTWNPPVERQTWRPEQVQGLIGMLQFIGQLGK